MEANEYMNSLSSRTTERRRCSLGRSKVYQLIGVSFVLLCITQSALNVYLWYQSDGISKSMNVSACNVTFLEEVPAFPSEREQLLQKIDLKQIDKLLQDKGKLLGKNKQLQQDRVSLNEKNKLLEQEKDQLFNEKRELLQNIDKLENETKDYLQENKILSEEKAKLLQLYEQLKQEKNEMAKDENVCKLYQEKLKLQEEKDLLERKNKELEDKIVAKEKEISELRAMISTVEVNKPKCPPGWQRFMSSCYQLSAEANTWMYAKRNCESKGAQLMMLNDETEQRPFIGGVLKIWIGLFGQIKNKTLIWYLRRVDGRLLKSGGPNTPKPQFWTSFSKGCVYIDQSLPCMKTWSMGSCMEKFYWICETAMVADLLEM